MVESLGPEAGGRSRWQARPHVIVVLCLVAALLSAWRSTARATPEVAHAASEAEVARAVEVVRRDPLGAAGFIELAAALFHRGDLARAVAAAREASRLEPAVAAHHRLLGYLCTAAGAIADAEAAFARAAALDPAEHTPLADFRLAQARAEYEQQLRLGPPDAAVEQRLRGIALLAAGTPELETLLRAPWTAAAQPAPFVPPVALFAPASHALIVEKRNQTLRLYARHDRDLVLLRTYPCTTGQEPGAKAQRGDLRTPDGVYVITALRAGDQLPGVYGALALTLNYPNAWDRHQHRGGYGIWIHGSDRLSAPFTARDTRGCVLMRNEDLSQLAALVTPGITPVVIAEEIPYRAAADWQRTVAHLLHDVPAQGVLAVAATSEYTALIRQEGAELVRDFVQPEPWRIVATERTPLVDRAGWQGQLAAVVPDAPTWVVRVGVQNGVHAQSVVIEISAPVDARSFVPDSAARLFVDLPGARPGPMPATIAGDGPWVRAVTVGAANFDPPITRVAIDLRQPADYRIVQDGNLTVVSLGKSR